MLSGFLLLFFHSTKFYLCFADFFVRILKTRYCKSIVFFKIRLKKGLWITWSKRLESFVKLMAQNSISGSKSRFLLGYCIWVAQVFFNQYKLQYEKCPFTGRSIFIEFLLPKFLSIIPIPSPPPKGQYRPVLNNGSIKYLTFTSFQGQQGPFRVVRGSRL
jgi:hypothetical protein